MPRYIVTERRAYDARYLIEAENEESAKNGSGEIIEEDDGAISSWAHELLSVEETTAEEL